MPSSPRVDSGSIVVAATTEDVYRAFADPKLLIAWLPPGDMTGRVLEYDFRDGGRYRIELTYAPSAPADVGKTSGRVDVSGGRFISIVPAQRIVQSVEFEASDPAFAGQMIMTWSFEAHPLGTLVTIRAENVPSGISKADHDEGLRSSLENLARFLSSAQRPDPAG